MAVRIEKLKRFRHRLQDRRDLGELKIDFKMSMFWTTVSLYFPSCDDRFLREPMTATITLVKPKISYGSIKLDADYCRLTVSTQRYEISHFAPACY